MIRPVLARRERVLPAVQAFAFLVGIVAALALGLILLWTSGHNPAEVYERMFDSAFVGTDSLSRTLERATPLALTGLSVAVAGSMGLWNIGAEGQMMAGAIVATGVAMMADGLSGPLLIALMIVAGIAGGMVLMLGPALARSHLRVSEIITTLMLVYVAIRVVEWLETGPWKDPRFLWLCGDRAGARASGAAGALRPGQHRHADCAGPADCVLAGGVPHRMGI